MKIKYNEYPPNYDEILTHFPNAKNNNVVFTYGNILFSPTSTNIPKDLLVHEETHSKQQKNHKGGIVGWWKQYINNKEFRVKQEVEAYQNQYNYIKNHYGRSIRRRLLRKISKDLSGKLYNNCMSFEEAKRKILEI